MSQDGKSMEVKAPIHVASSNGVDFLNTLNELLKSQDLSLNIANSEGKLRVSMSSINSGEKNTDFKWSYLSEEIIYFIGFCF